MSDFSSEEVASFERIVKTRRSVRGFLDKRVPEEVLRKVFDIARWSPSGTNVQPWHVCVASGSVRDDLRAEMMRRISKKIPINTDHPPDGKVDTLYRERKRACARALYNAMDIEWEDKQGRAAAYEKNYTLFDAPHAAFICMHGVFGTQTAADVGMFSQTLMLAMTANGIASCAQGTLRNYPDLVRETFGLPEDMKVLYGISFGYEDISAGANTARTERAEFDENFQFMG
ncbi:MAG: nitroreductase [Pseudomonadales bacterium]|nr:nitroreductase [Pseudomonadales bacterium]